MTTELAAVASEHVQAKGEALQEAVAAIRRLENAVASALPPGERFPNLPNLMTREAPFFGVRLRASRRIAYVDATREVLIVDDRGTLLMCKRDPAVRTIQARHAEDEDLKYEDLPAYVGTIARLSVRYIERRGADVTKLRKIVALANFLKGAPV